jgi:hypothetical protein
MSKLYLITYDRNGGDNYESLYERIKQCGNAWHGMQNTWFVQSHWTALQVAEHCWAVMDANDKLFVSEVVANSAWAGFQSNATSWLQTRIAA